MQPYDRAMSKSIALFLPPLPSLSGGMWVLLHLGEHLARLGHKVRFVILEDKSPAPVYALVRQKTSLPVVGWAEAGIEAGHTWIVPEGWPHALILGLRAEARCIVYMQNWAFALRTLPENVFWHQLPVDFLYVSEPVRHALCEITGKDGPILRPGIDTSLFFADTMRHASAPLQAHEPLRIAWMPRKNKGLSGQIMDAFSQRMARLYPTMPIQWVEIAKMPHEEVGQVLRPCHIFLITGFPEGCPLPPLEAMASGCIPVGFTGLGGWDYMRQASINLNKHFLARPCYAMAPTPVDTCGLVGGNGFFVEDAHVLAAMLALEEAVHLLQQGGEPLATLRKNLALTASAYALDKQFEQVKNLEPFFTA